MAVPSHLSEFSSQSSLKGSLPWHKASADNPPSALLYLLSSTSVHVRYNMAIQRGAHLSPPHRAETAPCLIPCLLCISFHQNLIFVNIGQLFVMGLIVIIVGVGSSSRTQASHILREVVHHVFVFLLCLKDVGT